jgi:hypothetical protein
MECKAFWFPHWMVLWWVMGQAGPRFNNEGRPLSTLSLSFFHMMMEPAPTWRHREKTEVQTEENQETEVKITKSTNIN